SSKNQQSLTLKDRIEIRRNKKKSLEEFMLENHEQSSLFENEGEKARFQELIENSLRSNNGLLQQNSLFKNEINIQSSAEINSIFSSEKNQRSSLFTDGIDSSLKSSTQINTIKNASCKDLSYETISSQVEVKIARTDLKELL